MISPIQWLPAFSESWQFELIRKPHFVQLAFYGGYFYHGLYLQLSSLKSIIIKLELLLGLGPITFLGSDAFLSSSRLGKAMASFWLHFTFGPFWIAFLENTANPYILAMGPESTATPTD